jgi:hypothetical protein
MLVQKAVFGGLLKTNMQFGGFHSAAGLFVSEEFEKRPKRMTKRLLSIMTNGETRWSTVLKRVQKEANKRSDLIPLGR